MSTTSHLVPLAVAATKLEVPKQTLNYYRRLGKLTVIEAGRIRLVDLEVTRSELELAGYYKRAENKRKREAAPTG